jgi:hypothetical protein
LVFDPPRLSDSSRRVEDLERYEVTNRVVVQDHSGLILVTFGDGDSFLEDEA